MDLVAPGAAAPHPALYPRLLGPAFDHLAGSLRRLYQGERLVRAAGRFLVLRGLGLLARLIAFFFALPRAGEDVPFTLVVTPHRDGESWTRVFAHRVLATRQRDGERGLLIEDIGPLRLQFRLSVVEDSLRTELVATSLRLGPLTLPLPRLLCPRIFSETTPADGTRGDIAVRVEIRAPLAGLLLSYQGEIRLEEPR